MTGFCPYKKGLLKESECHYDGYCSECPHNTKDDTISRRVAIETLETVGYDFSDSGLSEIELEEVCEAVGDVRQDMINRIKRVPPAQPTFELLSMEKFVEEISPTTPDTIAKWLDLARHIYGMGYVICRK